MKEIFEESGWLAINKPEGIESFGIIRELKFKFKFNGISNNFRYEKKNKPNIKEHFIENSEINMGKEPGYITFGKGFNEN